MKITGTFVQPLPGDAIPVMNWEEKEWDQEFGLMKKLEIDTIILLRSALGKWLAFPSEFLQKEFNCFEPSYDFLGMYLRLCEKHGMKMFVPNFTPLHDWLSAAYDPKEEFRIARTLFDEIWAKYGSSPAFGGWYFTQEIGGREAFRVVEMFQMLGPYCKKISGGLPTLLSPAQYGPRQESLHQYPRGMRKRLAQLPEKHREDWDWIMKELRGAVDIIAFQDGNTDFEDLDMMLSMHVELAKKHGITCWSNVESFCRDYDDTRFPPIPWEELQFKLKAAERAGNAKAITYEFVPFLSPHGCYPQSKYLLRRYCERYGFDIEIK